MNEIKAYDGFVLFTALKLHFTSSSYDYFKYHGKVKANPTQFSVNKDRFKFQKLVRMVKGKEELTDFIVANLIAEKKWIGQFLDDDAMENYRKRKTYKESLTYNFTQEVEKLAEHEKPFSVKGVTYPRVLEAYMYSDISLETLVLLNIYIDFFPKIDSNVGADDIIWKPIRLLAMKYRPFLSFDKNKITRVLSEKFLTT